MKKALAIGGAVLGALLAAALVIIRHHENFAKLMKGTESKFSLSSKKS